MLKGLRELKELQKHHYGTLDEFDRKLSIIEKELKALEIIKKYVYVSKPYGTSTYIKLNDESEFIPEKEYDLLKEILC